eukprot:364670-Chlamydomonas_euryale.AAC.4
MMRSARPIDSACACGGAARKLHGLAAGGAPIDWAAARRQPWGLWLPGAEQLPCVWSDGGC